MGRPVGPDVVGVAPLSLDLDDLPISLPPAASATSKPLPPVPRKKKPGVDGKKFLVPAFTFIVAAGWFVFAFLIHGHYVLGAVSLFGALLAGGLLKTNLTKGTRNQNDWKDTELAICFTLLAIYSAAVVLFSLYRAYLAVEIGLTNGFTPRLNGFLAGIVIGGVIVMGVVAGFYVLCKRFGFFLLASWIYLVVFSSIAFAMMIFSGNRPFLSNSRSAGDGSTLAEPLPAESQSTSRRRNSATSQQQGGLSPEEKAAWLKDHAVEWARLNALDQQQLDILQKIRNLANAERMAPELRGLAMEAKPLRRDFSKFFAPADKSRPDGLLDFEASLWRPDAMRIATIPGAWQKVREVWEDGDQLVNESLIAVIPAVRSQSEKSFGSVGGSSVDNMHDDWELRQLQSTVDRFITWERIADGLDAERGKLICADPPALKENLRWCPALKRPTTSIMVGVGIELAGGLAGMNGPAVGTSGRVFARGNRRSLKDQWNLATKMPNIGGRPIEWIFEGTQVRVDRGDFGAYGLSVSHLDRQLKGFALIDTASKESVFELARAVGVDVMFTMSLETKPGVTELKRATMKVKVYNVANDQAVFESKEGVTGAQVAAGIKKGQDPSVALVEELFKYIDENVRLQDMRTLSKEAVQKRVAKLAEAKGASLARIAEVCYYQQGELITPDEAKACFAKIVGKAKAEQLISSEPAQRYNAIKGLLPVW